MTTRTSPAPAGLLHPSLHCLAFAVALGSAGAALAKDVTWEDIANDDKTTGDVLQYGMGTHAQRWSPLKQVNADNVFKLTPAWSYSFGDEKQRGQESQAIVSDGVIYVTASYSRLFALDAKTGKRLWTYNHRLPDDIRPCCDVVNRGAAIYGDKVFFGTLDASVVALNKNTGKVVWKKKFADHGAGYTMTGAPTIVKDGKTGKVLLIHGSSGDEFGVVGRLFARDPDTGEEIWMRPFVEGHMGRLNGKDSTVTGDVKAPSWPDDRNSPTGKVESWSHGGGAPWQSASFDAETNTIIRRRRQPRPVEHLGAHRQGRQPARLRQPLHLRPGRGGPEQRRGEVVLPAHPQRRLGTSPATTNWCCSTTRPRTARSSRPPPTPTATASSMWSTAATASCRTPSPSSTTSPGPATST
ncbi:quinoprotein alcohol dehydrogenase [Pseudomonas aeruginosa]|nr:quinoprotein alcohol dehydrogenase [Pseudomonas aeruginosa]